MSRASYRHTRVTDAEYRVRKRREHDEWTVTEWYKGDRIQLCDVCETEEKANAVAHELAYRTEF